MQNQGSYDSANKPSASACSGEASCGLARAGQVTRSERRSRTARPRLALTETSLSSRTMYKAYKLQSLRCAMCLGKLELLLPVQALAPEEEAQPRLRLVTSRWAEPAPWRGVIRGSALRHGSSATSRRKDDQKQDANDADEDPSRTPVTEDLPSNGFDTPGLGRAHKRHQQWRILAKYCCAAMITKCTETALLQVRSVRTVCVVLAPAPLPSRLRHVV